MRRRRANLLAQVWKFVVMTLTVRMVARHVRGRRPGRHLGWR